MNSVIIDINEMSDSKEAYEARPHRGITIFIYSIIAVIAIAIFWMCFTKLDVSIKANGMFRQTEEIPTISCGVTGKVKKVYVKDGDYVEKGDIIASIDILNLDEDKKSIDLTLSQLQARTDILKAYIEYLDGNTQVLDEYKGNQYYDEINNKINLLNANIHGEKAELDAKTNEYQLNIDSLKRAINDYADKISKLQQAEDCIRNKKNNFNNTSEAYYFNIVSGYLLEYNANVASYDNQILSVKNTAMTDSADAVKYKIKELEIEKTHALDKLKEQHIASVEELIETTKKEQKNAQSQLDTVLVQKDNLKSTNTENIAVLTEKGNIEAELSEISGKIEEAKRTRASYDEQEKEGEIKAEYAGTIRYKQEMGEGVYLSSGTEIAALYPESNDEFYAEVYIENNDIGKVRKDQKVKLEVSSYPSSEYGYYEGIIEMVASDITVNTDTGAAYYNVKVKCDRENTEKFLREDETLINGLAVQAKIITDEKSVFQYVMDKIDLFE